MALGIGKKGCKRLNIKISDVERIDRLAPSSYYDWQDNREDVQEYFPQVDNWLMACFNMPRRSEIIMAMFDELLDGFGVETIEGEYVDHFHQSFIAYYVNMGDTYNTTVIRNNRLGRYIVTSWGDWIENQ